MVYFAAPVKCQGKFDYLIPILKANYIFLID